MSSDRSVTVFGAYGHTGRFVWQVFAASGGNPVINASFTAIGPDQQSINMTVACQ